MPKVGASTTAWMQGAIAEATRIKRINTDLKAQKKRGWG
jgi:hypothetical protein